MDSNFIDKWSKGEYINIRIHIILRRLCINLSILPNSGKGDKVMDNQKVCIKDICIFLFSYLWKKQTNEIKLRTIFVLILVLLVVATNVSLPVFFKLIIDKVNDNSAFKTGFLLFLVYGLLWLFTQVFTNIREILALPILEETTKKAILEMYSHLNKLTLDFHLKKQLGSIVSVFEKAEHGIPYFYYGVLFFVLPLFIEIILSGTILSEYLGIKYSIVLISMMIIYLFLNFWGAKWQSTLQREKNIVDMEAKNIFVDRIANFESIKYLNRTNQEIEYFNNHLIKKQKISLRTYTRASLLNIFQSLVIGLTFLYLVTDSGIRVIEGDITKGDFIMLNTYFIQLSAPLRFYR